MCTFKHKICPNISLKKGSKTKLKFSLGPKILSVFKLRGPKTEQKMKNTFTLPKPCICFFKHFINRPHCSIMPLCLSFQGKLPLLASGHCFKVHYMGNTMGSV